MTSKVVSEKASNVEAFTFRPTAEIADKMERWFKANPHITKNTLLLMAVDQFVTTPFMLNAVDEVRDATDEEFRRAFERVKANPASMATQAWLKDK